jgi:hypothetical protein
MAHSLDTGAGLFECMAIKDISDYFILYPGRLTIKTPDLKSGVT